MAAIESYMIPEVIGIWGGGLIGLSTAAHFARKGVKSIVYDINTIQVSRINNKIFPSNFEKWIGFSVAEFVDSGSIRATTDVSDLPRASVKTHFIAVATERNGEPDMSNLQNVLQQIAELSPDLCVIESTVIPGRTEAFNHKYGLPLGVATRRDWFTLSENNLENCIRVYAGVNDKASERMHAILSVVCKKLARASSCTVVELTKCLDNGIFHTTAMYASQVASAYPNTNVAESLRLAATHWRLGNHVYFPSLGTGGHCVPLANKYLLSGALHPHKLAIASEALRFDAGNPLEVAAIIKQQLKIGDRVAVLGICYRGDIRVHIESPHLKFARALVRLGVQVGVHDPYYTNAELSDVTGGIPLKFPEDLKDFQFVYVGANHAVYKTRIYSVLAFMSHGQSILDNQGVWETLADDAQSLGITYHRVGGPRWLPVDPTGKNNLTIGGAVEHPPRHVVLKTKWFQIHTIPDPRSLSLDPYYVLDRADSATVIPLSPTGRLLLQKQYRPHTGCNSWEFPMGFVDRDESPEQAAKRELFEETSLTCDSIRLLGSYYPLPGLATQRTHVFLATVTDKQLDEPRSLVQDEGISAFQVLNLSAFQSLAAAGEVLDGFTLAAFALWQSVSSAS
jgi:nucleotide sugar dehydrogenase